MKAIKAKPILGNKTFPIEKLLKKYGGLAVKEMEKTTETWNNVDPSFEYEIDDAENSVHAGPADDEDGQIWTYLDEGTDVRRAVMTEDFEAKTTVGVVGSTAGVGGLAYVSPDLELPGIEAREWSIVIGEKLLPKFAKDAQAMIKKTLRTLD